MIDFNWIPTMLKSAVRPVWWLFARPSRFYRTYVAGTVDALRAGDVGTIIGVALAAIAIIAILLIFGLKEPHRRFFVALKRKPQNIPLVILAIAFVVYSFNLSDIAYTTSRINGPGMGLVGFATMLCSTMILVCCLNAFPYRKKVKVPMLVLLLVLICVVMYCDCFYYGAITDALTRETNRFAAEAKFLAARDVVCTHFFILCLGVLAVALLPVYTPLIRRIRTSIDVEGNEDMAAIDIAGE